MSDEPMDVVMLTVELVERADEQHATFVPMGVAKVLAAEVRRLRQENSDLDTALTSHEMTERGHA